LRLAANAAAADLDDRGVTTAAGGAWRAEQVLGHDASSDSDHRRRGVVFLGVNNSRSDWAPVRVITHASIASLRETASKKANWSGTQATLPAILSAEHDAVVCCRNER
jgi:hypothetical protein